MTSPVPDCTNSPVPTPVPLSAAEARQSARDAYEPGRTAVSPDPAQAARRALLWYLATATPMPHPGISNHADIPLHDLVGILRGLITGPVLGAAWDEVTTAASNLARFLADGGAGNPTGQRWLEDLLADAINSAAPDREADRG